jgi:hypothetical protein
MLILSLLGLGLILLFPALGVPLALALMGYAIYKDAQL